MSALPGTWDAVVVGAGPAGAVTALELARAGASVLLVDRRPFPRWKVCGSCLSPGTLQSLRDAGLGASLDALAPAPLHTLRLAGWGTRADVPLGPSAALSRAALDQALVEAARAAGATWLAPARIRLGPVEEGFRLLTLDEAGDLRRTLRARVVVAADGVGSPLLAATLGRPAPPPPPDAPVGFGALFGTGERGAYAAGVIHMAVSRHGYVGAVRLEDGTLDVAAALSPGALRGGARPEALVDRILEEAGLPALPPRPDAGWRGTPLLSRHPGTRGGERVLAVGDAAGYVEPFTGEGMGWAVAGARALAPLAVEGIRRWRPALVAEWNAIHAATVGSSARLCRGIGWTLRRPALTRVGLEAVRHFPGLAAPLVRRAGRPPRIDTRSSVT